MFRYSPESFTLLWDLWLPCLLPQCVTLKASPPTTSCLGVCFRVTSRACLREAKDGWRQDMVQSETDSRGLHMPWRVPGVAGGSLGFGITRCHLNKREGVFLQFLNLPRDGTQHRGGHTPQLMPRDSMDYTVAQPPCFQSNVTRCHQQYETPVRRSQRKSLKKRSTKLPAQGLSVQPLICRLSS